MLTKSLTFSRDKKKDFAPDNAAYNPFGVDVYLCPKKINHIARFVELPVSSSSGKFPPVLVVNIQVYTQTSPIESMFS